MITEEEALKNRIKSSIAISQKQLDELYEEMSAEPYKVCAIVPTR